MKVHAADIDADGDVGRSGALLVGVVVLVTGLGIAASAIRATNLLALVFIGNGQLFRRFCNLANR